MLGQREERELMEFASQRFPEAEPPARKPLETGKNVNWKDYREWDELEDYTRDVSRVIKNALLHNSAELLLESGEPGGSDGGSDVATFGGATGEEDRDCAAGAVEFVVARLTLIEGWGGEEAAEGEEGKEEGSKLHCGSCGGKHWDWGERWEKKGRVVYVNI